MNQWSVAAKTILYCINKNVVSKLMGVIITIQIVRCYFEYCIQIRMPYLKAGSKKIGTVSKLVNEDDQWIKTKLCEHNSKELGMFSIEKMGRVECTSIVLFKYWK